MCGWMDGWMWWGQEFGVGGCWVNSMSRVEEREKLGSECLSPPFYHTTPNAGRGDFYVSSKGTTSSHFYCVVHRYASKAEHKSRGVGEYIVRGALGLRMMLCRRYVNRFGACGWVADPSHLLSQPHNTYSTHTPHFKTTNRCGTSLSSRRCSPRSSPTTTLSTP